MCKLQVNIYNRVILVFTIKVYFSFKLTPDSTDNQLRYFMRKLNSHLVIFLLISALNFVLFSCNWEWEDSTKQRRPDIDNTNVSIKVTVQKISEDTQHIQIIRKEDGDTSSRCIGIIFPKSFDKKNASYLFEDTYVVSGTKYSYMTRYMDKNGEYIESNWTDPYEAKFGATEKSVLKYTIPTTVKVKFSATDFSLNFENGSDILYPSGITDFDILYKAGIIINSPDNSQIFPISSDKLNGNELISLKGLLPESYYGKELTLGGLVGIRTETVSETDETPIRVYFTDASDLVLYEKSKKIDSFVVSSDGGTDGFDYSLPSE